MTRFRRWRLALSLGLLAAALFWLGMSTVKERQVAYSSGPLARAHAFFYNQCSTCHVNVINGVKSVGFKNKVPDSACLSCHQAPAHHSDQVFIPPCASCHIEHKGALHLARVADSQCTQCHADLHTATGRSRYVSGITSFIGRHPEFSALRDGARDPGTIAFNHAAHLSDYILGPNGRVKLECDDCHRPTPEAGGPWKYSLPGLKLALAAESAGQIVHPGEGRELMSPVTYEKQCAACHTLQFDKQFADSVPHVKPEEVHAFLLKKYRDHIAADPAAIHTVPVRLSQIPGYVPPPAPRSAEEWVSWRTAQAEYLLWHKTCKLCHQLAMPHAGEQSAGLLPKVLPGNIIVRWMPHAVFDHEAHRAIECASCHAAASSSQRTSDVLIPGIKTCQSCHAGGMQSTTKTESGCYLCHQYHDWSRRIDFKGRYAIPQLTGQAEEPTPAAVVQVAQSY
ncbi:MAG TPA: cytochrome c3 family protein [Terriglobales bacterium]|nr:cytochrome c3 family protein [Terriglobales bacterium]